jgi:hypothetical protein
MNRYTAQLILASLLLMWASTDAMAKKNRAQIKDGFYISLGVGAATVDGTRGVEMDFTDGCENVIGGDDIFLWVETNGSFVTCVGAPGGSSNSRTENFGEIVRTDYGSGAAVQLRMGYTINGLVTPEFMLAGNGPMGSFDDGMGHVGMRLRYHPAQHWKPGEDRMWDVGMYYGYGFSIGGYNHDDIGGLDTGKGWIGTFHTTGITAEYAATDVVAYGVDLGWIMPQYTGWIVNWSDDVVSAPKEPPPTTVFAPIVYLSFRP